MKTIIASVLMLASVSAMSASIKLHETTNFSGGNVFGEYGINEEMGRAWVELSIVTSYSGDETSYDEVRMKVPGLSIVNDSVVLIVDGTETECAKIKTTRLFKNRVAKATGNCVFKTKVEKRVHDNGYETYKVPTLVISLETK